MCPIGEQKRVLAAFISLSVITKLLYSWEWIRKCPLFLSRLPREYEANTGIRRKYSRLSYKVRIKPPEAMEDV
jgi:hypothetical protein